MTELIEYRSSVQEFEDFVKSSVWADMVDELNRWLGDVHVILEDPNGDLKDKALHRAGGNAETIRNVHQMPEVIRDNIKASSEAKPNEEG